uniref:LPS export ABC transporter permease LptF n=1 Tax=Desulfobacca acetoxidans TaxID=60893 RepID=A0A7V4G814_9BACT
MLTIIDRYLLEEILHPFAVSLLAFTSIVFSGRLMLITKMILVKGVGLLDILKSCVYLLPYLLIFTLPMAATVGIILALMRLSVDNEMMALKTAGLSYGRLMAPIFGFALLVALGTLYLTVYASPWGQRSTRELFAEVSKKRADLGLQEQTFNTDFQNLMLFVNQVSAQDNRLQGVFIYDSRERDNPQTIFARSGEIYYDPAEEGMALRLFDGVMVRWGKDLEHRQTVDFKSYQISLELFAFSVKGLKLEREMYLQDLKQAMKDELPGTEAYNRLAVEYQQRFALPLGALLLCLLAVPLGLSPRIHGRTWGLIMGLLIFLVYYIVFTASWRLAVGSSTARLLDQVTGYLQPRAAWLDPSLYPTLAPLAPHLAPYLANLFFALVAVAFWRRTLKELPLLPGAVHLGRFLPWRRPVRETAAG